MCGIAGAARLDREPISPGLIHRMTDAIAHRGPDGQGHFTDGPVSLGHRRLAIIDLSPAGYQPMGNETGDILLTCNAEIYNYEKLRAELEAAGHRFHSRTDVETIVHGYEEWGDSVIGRLNGMFAIGLWDGPGQRLLLARDRFGVKPIYWYHGNGVFLFASEIKAILQHPDVRREVDPLALDEYFTFQNVLSDRTLFDGIRLLPAGHTLVVDVRNGTVEAPKKYWDYPFPAEPMKGVDAVEAGEELYRLFTQAVTRQLMSDVPVGSYLSGGMDSGSITAIAARELPRLCTFTGGFDLSSASGLELGFDERETAESVANVLQTEHYEVVLHAGDMEWVLPELTWHLEDLRVGQSYPNYYIARLASKFVKVVMSGAGGDELFGGYPWRYFHGATDGGRDDYLRRYYDFWQRLVPDSDKSALFVGDVRRSVGNDGYAFETFRSVFDGYGGRIESPEDCVTASLYFELKTFLHGLLVVEDKLSMAHGLETRVPFLDNDLVDFASNLPANLKIKDLDSITKVDENELGKRHRFETETNAGKALLRTAMARLISPEVQGRRMQGFSAPDASWFRGQSIGYINTLLLDPKAEIYGFLSRDYVTRVIDEHTAGKVNHRLLIWSLLNFEWWCRSFLSPSGIPTGPHSDYHIRPRLQ
jgi:asparagine synthase (glutamine-hydrolysing)